jgi:hypothetical protein
MNNRVLRIVVGFLTVVCVSFNGDAESGAVSSPPVFNVRDYGAIGDGAANDTAGLQTAIDACHKTGDGMVWVPRGQYVVGTLVLKSHVHLHLASSAVILGSKDLSRYATNIARCGFVNESAIDKCLVYAEHADHISITGSGTIDGQGGSFPGRLPDGKLGERPMLIRFFQCTNVVVETVTLRSAGAWCSHYRECDGVRIHGISINNRANGNGDGIDLMSTRNVRISDCTLLCEDDAICFQNMSDERAVENIVIDNCIMSTRWAAIRSGGAHRGGIRRVTVSNCVIMDTYGCGIKLQVSGNGSLEDMTFDNIVMTRVSSPLSLRFGNHHYNNETRDPAYPFGKMRNLVFSNIRASVLDEAELRKKVPNHYPGEQRQCISICGIPGQPVEGITLSDIQVTFPGGGTHEEAAKRDMPELADDYPEYFMWGVLPAYGLYVRHARNITLNNVRFELAKPDLRPAVVCDDVQGLELAGFKAQADASVESLIRLRAVQGAFIHDSRPLDDIGTFVRVDGVGSKDVVLAGNDLAHAKQAVEKAEGAAAAPSAARETSVPVVDTKGLPPRTLPTGPPSRPTVPWVQTDLRIAHLPPADWRQIAAYGKAGYQVIAVNTLEKWDHVGPRSNDFPAQVAKEADAYLRRFVGLVHDAGAKAVFYLGPVQSPIVDGFRQKHPDWLRVNEDGSMAKDFVNFRNPEVVNWLCEQLAYLAREYKADGFWFDGYSPVALHTYDSATREAFKQFSNGADIPFRGKLRPQDPVGRMYLQWHEAYFAEVADRTRQAVRAANPNCVIYGNYSANRTWYMPDWPMGEYPAYYANAIDLPSVELYWDNPGDALFQQFAYAFTQGTSHDRGARVWVQPHLHGTLGTPPALELMLRCLEGAPWGVYTEFVENTEREEYYRMYVSHVKAREDWWKQSEAIPYIGIVASEQTRLLLGKDTLPKYFSHTLGAFRAVFEQHWPVRILSEYDLENGDLQGIKVLMLPDVRVLSDRCTEVVRRFVKAGGGLVASGGTGLYDHTLTRRTNFSLADLFQADYVASHEVNSREGGASLWLAKPEHPILKDEGITGEEKTAWRNPSGPPAERGWLELVSSWTTVRAHETNQVLVAMSTNENLAAASPAMIASIAGQGRVVYLPAELDQAMFFYPNTYISRMLVNAVKWAAGEALPPVEVDGPLMLATTFRRQPAQNRVVVHLLNDQSSYGRHSIYQKLTLPDHSVTGPWTVRREVIPLHDIKVRCRLSGVTNATLQPENLSLPVTRTADGVEAVVPKLEMYSMVVFE